MEEKDKKQLRKSIREKRLSDFTEEEKKFFIEEVDSDAFLDRITYELNMCDKDLKYAKLLDSTSNLCGIALVVGAYVGIVACNLLGCFVVRRH
ncbi:MAG: hypothetical protein ACI35S_00630 [Anaeroplasma sp.]